MIAGKYWEKANMFLMAACLKEKAQKLRAITSDVEKKKQKQNVNIPFHATGNR